MPPDALPAWLCSVWAWLCGAWESVCDVETWGRAVVAWLFAPKGPDDSAFLGAIFALDASVASVDSISEGILKPIREKVARLAAECHELRASGGKGEARISDLSAEQQEKLYALVDEALAFDDRIPDLFQDRTRFWKRVMGICATVALICLAIPYLGRIFLFLALPVPLFILRCNREGDCFLDEVRDKRIEIDEFIKMAGQKRALQGNEVLSRLERVEKVLGDIAAKLDSTTPDLAAPKSAAPRHGSDGESA